MYPKSNNILKLGVVFLTKPVINPKVFLPLVLPIGRKNSPLIFSTSTETIANIANQRINYPDYQPRSYRLNQMVANIHILIRAT